MQQMPSSSNDLPANIPFDGFNRESVCKSLGIVAGPATEVSRDEIKEGLRRAGQIVRQKYGDQVFQNDLGRKINEDLKNLQPGCEVRVVDQAFLLIISGAEAGYRVELGFPGESPKVATIEGKGRINEGLGLKFSLGEADGV